jgi:hypothetical protein
MLGPTMKFIFLTDFREILRFLENTSRWQPNCSMRTDGHTDRQTDMTKLSRVSKFCDDAQELRKTNWIR